MSSNCGPRMAPSRSRWWTYGTYRRYRPEMRRIGIDNQFFYVYHDVGNYFREIVPPPILCEALFDPGSAVEFSMDLQFAAHVFREDDFDPTARLRRGRFYQRANLPQPSQHGVLPRTAEDYEGLPRPRNLFVFNQYQLPSNVRPPQSVALGSAESVWRVVSRPERISTGEFLFVLKARHSFGVLPELDQASMPEWGKKKAIETVEKLTDAAHRESPSSIIDRARDAAQSCLGTWAAAKFQDETLTTADLG